MNKLRLMTIVGIRPEVIRMPTIIRKAHQYFDHTLVHTGQNYDYELNKIFSNDLGLRGLDHYPGVAGENLGQTMENVISKSYELMSVAEPNAAIVLRDTNSCLCVVSVKRLKIPVFHMEAGNRYKDESLSGEVIRRTVDVTSGINLRYPEHARRYILDSGAKPEYAFVVDPPMAEVLTDCKEKIDNSDVLKRLGSEAKKYILSSAHREEDINIEKNSFSLTNTVNVMTEKYDTPILYSCHPRSKKYIEQHGSIFDKGVIWHQPLGFFDYNRLQQDVSCVVLDSGMVLEEGIYFKSPAIPVCTPTERPEAMGQGVPTTGLISARQILQAVELVTAMYASGDLVAEVSCYQDRAVPTRTIKIIQSYSGTANKTTWRE